MGTTGASTHQQTSSLQPPRNSKRDPAPATAGGRHRRSSNPLRHSTSGTDQETGMALYEPWCCQRRVHSKNCASGQHRLCWQATGERNQGCPGLSMRNKWELDVSETLSAVALDWGPTGRQLNRLAAFLTYLWRREHILSPSRSAWPAPAWKRWGSMNPGRSTWGATWRKR